MKIFHQWNGDGRRIAVARIADWQQELFGEEMQYGNSLSGRRRDEFIAGRSLARALLTQAGIAPVALPRRADGVTVWPEGFYGSISHSKQWVAAAVSHAPVGIDLEHIDRVRPALLARIATPAELRRLDGCDAIHRAIVFSAKEAYYKLQYPETGKQLGFLDAEVTSEDDGNIAIADARGGWRRIDDDLLLTAVWYEVN